MPLEQMLGNIYKSQVRGRIGEGLTLAKTVTENVIDIGNKISLIKRA